MINLAYPRDDENVFYFKGPHFLGPTDLNLVYRGAKTSFHGSLHNMEEAVGIYGENAVTHDKIEGDFEYCPISGVGIPSPTEACPKRMKYTVYDPWTRAWTPLYADLGAAAHYGTTYRYTSSDRSIICQYAYFRDATINGWIIYEIQSFTSNPTVVANRFVFRIERLRKLGPDSTYVDYRSAYYDTGQGGLQTSTDWSMPQDYNTIVSLFPSTNWANLTLYAAYNYYYKVDVDQINNPRTLKEKLDVLTASIFPEDFPITEVRYGDLAVGASESMNVNHTNMISFFNDLRHLKSLVPKLNNLTRLKTLSNNYLSVKYGVLPTVSDLQSIAKAFRTLKPYLDSNGFSTYSAGHTVTEEVNGVVYTLEQHAKLAFGNTDQNIVALINKLESWGTLPTLSNVWDLVPYSFVLDWFIDVGSFLGQLDSLARVGRYGLRYVTLSRRQVRSRTFSSDQECLFSGSATRVHYHRWVSDQCPAPGLIPKQTFQGFNHWLESAALIIQRL